MDIDRTRAFGRDVDFGRSVANYAGYRAGFPGRLFRELAARGIGRPGQLIHDVGTGTGAMAFGLAPCGAAVSASDPSADMLAAAELHGKESGLQVDFRIGRAERIDAPDACYDVVTAGQCWHWFDRPEAAREICRVLKPGGTVLVAHFDWIPLPGNVVSATERLILECNPAWTLGGGTGLYPMWLEDLSRSGFEDLETFSFDEPVPYSHEAWRGRIQASAGVQATLDRREAAGLDRRLASLLRRFADPCSVPHRCWAVTGKKPAQRGGS